MITSGVSSLVETLSSLAIGASLTGRDRDVDRRRVGSAVAVGDRVGEAVRAVEVGGRRVGERAVAVVHHRAVGRLREAGDRERVQVESVSLASSEAAVITSGVSSLVETLSSPAAGASLTA